MADRNISTLTQSEVPNIPSKIILSEEIGSVTANSGETVRAFSHTIAETGDYLVTFDVTPSADSSANSALYYTSVGTMHAYGSIYNGASLTRALRIYEGSIMYLDVNGANSGTNKMQKAYVTIVKL